MGIENCKVSGENQRKVSGGRGVKVADQLSTDDLRCVYKHNLQICTQMQNWILEQIFTLSSR